MPDALTIGLAFTNLFAWGFADIAAKRSLRGLTFWQLTLYFQAVSLALLIPVSIAVGALRLPLFDKAPLLFIAGILNVIAYMFFNFGLARGIVSTVTPISSAWGVIATTLAIFLFGEVVLPLKLAAIILTFVGLSLLTVEWKGARFTKTSLQAGAGPALAAMLSWAAVILMLKPVSQSFGGFETILWFRIIGVSATATLFLARRFPVRPAAGSTWVTSLTLASIAGVLDVTGFLAYTANIVRNDFSTIVPIVASNPVVAVLGARALLGDRVRWWQGLGIGLILLGIIGIAFQ